MHYIITFIFLFILNRYSQAIGIPKVNKVSAREPLPLSGVNGRDTLKLECSVGGNPFPQVHWTFKGVKIEETTKFKFERDSTVLLVHEVTNANSGQYRCFATNSFGSVFGQLGIKIPSIGSFDTGYKVTDPVREIKATIGKSLQIECSPHQEGQGQIYFWGDMPAHSTPIIWQAGSPVDRVFVARHGILAFSYLTQRDVDRVKNLGGISCILYQEKHSIQGVRYNIIPDGPAVDDKAPPKLIAFMEDEFITVEGERGATVLCGAIGRPQPRITWYKDGKKIYDPIARKVNGTNYKVKANHMQLIVQPVLKSSKGKYKCVAENSEGNDAKEGNMVVHSPASWIKELDEEMVVLFRNPIKLVCEAHGFPDVNYVWYHNNTIITSGDDYDIVDGKLVVAVSGYNNSGIYMCVASNYLLTIVSPSYVEVRAFAPTFEEHLQRPTYFFKRYTNTLFCNATAGPDPMKTWYRNDKEITTVGRYSVFTNGTLVLENSEGSDGGMYKCVAVNEKGSAETSATVKVVEKTVIFKEPAMLMKTEGFAFTQFLCDAKYEMLLDVRFEWLKDGSLMTFDNRVYAEKRVSGPSKIITLKDLKLEDAGKYSCRVYTSDGTRLVSADKKTGSLSVIAKPLAPSDVELSGDCATMDNVTISWTASRYFGAAVKYYRVEYASAKSSDKWYTYDMDTKSTEVKRILSKSQVPSSTDLIFRVKAVSVYEGEDLISESSEPTNSNLCVTPVGPPIINPTNVKSVIGGDGKLTIVWDQLDDIHKPGPDYEVVVGYRKIPDSKEFTNATVAGDKNSFVVPDPGSHQQYEIFVQAKNKFGLGPESKITVLYSGEPPITGVVNNLMVDSITSTGVVISWDPLTGATGYRIYYWVAGSKRKRRSSPLTPFKDVTGASNFTLTGLLPNNDYRVTVAASNTNGPGPESPQVSFKTKAAVPSVPTNVKLDVLGDALRLTWNPPASSNGDVTSYTVRWYKTNDPNATINTKKTSGDSKEAFITSDLDEMTYYTVELVANSDAGEGKVWKFDGVVISSSDKPGKPGNPFVVALNESILNVTFLLPADYYGGIPTYFTIYYSEQGKSNKKALKQEYPDQSWVLIEDLTYEKTYDIYAVSTNNLGDGTASNTVKGTPLSPKIDVVPAASDDPFYSKLWFIILIVLIVLLIILVIIVYLCCNRRGGKYPVGDKEKDRGGWDDNQPLKDYSEIPMDEVNGSPIPNKTNGEPVRSVSQTSLNKPPPYKDDGDDDDGDSLDDYGEDTKFNEDGSFIGQYGDESKQPLQV